MNKNYYDLKFNYFNALVPVNRMNKNYYDLKFNYFKLQYLLIEWIKIIMP